MTRAADIEVANTILYCDRWQACVEFYGAGLGLSECFRRDWFVEFELTKTARLSVADASRANVGSSGGRGLTITLRVTDICAARAELVARGLSPGEIRAHPWNAELFHVFDPDGNRVEYWAASD